MFFSNFMAYNIHKFSYMFKYFYDRNSIHVCFMKFVSYMLLYISFHRFFLPSNAMSMPQIFMVVSHIWQFSNVFNEQ